MSDCSATRAARRPPLEILQRDARRRVSAYAVDATTRRGRSGAEIDALDRRPVRDELAHGPKEQLAEIHRARIQVTADQIAVARLELARPHRVPGENELAESRRETLDLRLDPFRH